MFAKKIFLEFPYKKNETAIVTKVDGEKIFLDQTIFYPEGGGQIGDQGMINDIEIINCKKHFVKETIRLSRPDFPGINIYTDVVHVSSNPRVDLNVGDTVSLQLNWKRRYKIMRLHSAAHIVYFFTEKVFSTTRIKGCSITDIKSRLDFPFKLDPEKIKIVQGLSNEFICQDRPIVNEAVNNAPEALFWICSDIKMPCGGTHVANTSEIGEIVLRRRSQGKNLDRIYIDFA